MTLTRAVVIVWSRARFPPRPTPLIPTPIPSVSCRADFWAKLDSMVTAGQTDRKSYWGSPQISQFRFTDQAAADEFAGYLTTEFPCHEEIQSIVINNLQLSS